MSIKFAVFTDLHYDHIYDGRKRIESFIDNIIDSDIDFIIQLGDLCNPISENRFILDMLNSTGKPCYHILGNHDTDLYPKEKAIEFLGMDSSYYSFYYNNIKFITLDTCFIKTNDGYQPYFKRNYNKSTDIYPVIPNDELRWLENELCDDSKYYVIFSHHSLENDFAKRGVHNRVEVRNIIDKVNSTGKKILLCVNGHDHGGSIVKLGETHYFGLNSMSYLWFGEQYEHFCYSDDIHKQYPYLKDIVLFKEALYSIITITKNGGIEIQGMNGHYQTISPQELGIDGMWNGRCVTADVPSFKVNPK